MMSTSTIARSSSSGTTSESPPPAVMDSPGSSQGSRTSNEVVISLAVTGCLLGLLVASIAIVIVYFRQRQNQRIAAPALASSRRDGGPPGYKTSVNREKLKRSIGARLTGGADPAKEAVNWSNIGDSRGSNNSRRRCLSEANHVQFGVVAESADTSGGAEAEAEAQTEATVKCEDEGHLPRQQRRQQRRQQFARQRSSSWSENN